MCAPMTEADRAHYKALLDALHTRIEQYKGIEQRLADMDARLLDVERQIRAIYMRLPK